MNELLRPDSPGFFWCLRQGGRDGAQWHMVTAKMIHWPEEDDNAERVLSCTAGGCWQRCDMINRPGYDDGTRYFRATPPAWPNSVTSKQP
jgi:hypothetical protein